MMLKPLETRPLSSPLAFAPSASVRCPRCVDPAGGHVLLIVGARDTWRSCHRCRELGGPCAFSHAP